jgi:hypothetical protein
LVWPALSLELARRPELRAWLFRCLLFAVPVLSLWMVGAHALHGLALDRAARSLGARPAPARALRFGLYACGWDVITGPLGAWLALRPPRRPLGELGRAALSAPSLSSSAFLRGAYGLGPREALRAAQRGLWVAIGLALLSGLGAVGLLLLALR